MNLWRLAAIFVASAKEGVDAFARGLRARGLHQFARDLSNAPPDGWEEAGVVPSLVEFTQTASYLLEFLHEAALLALPSTKPKER
jgi:hypothetical protein